LFGGGAGDKLFAEGTRGQQLTAGTGNETLTAAASSGPDTLIAASGQDQLVGGSGSDTFVGGTGASTMLGGSGHDVFLFVRGIVGGTDLVENFTSSDKIKLQGYGPHAVQDALSSQTFAGGSATITLSDNTRVTFLGVSELTRNDFIKGH
jgi:Ca2+-binding RTX toxin-like protein